MKDKKIRFLICPLDWGLGHATRSAAIANILINRDHDVIFAASGKAYDFLEQEFPRNEVINFPSFRISYAKGCLTILKIFLKLPVILFHILKEHHQVKKLIRENNIDIVVSDNRLGLWNKNTYTIYITHQTRVLLTGLFKPFEGLLAFLMKTLFINHFNECWIPDLEKDNGLTGKLSHSTVIKPPCRHLGWTSRFQYVHTGTSIETSPVLAIVSGPEPGRTRFEQKIIQALASINMEAIVLRGVPAGTTAIKVPENVRVYNHLDSARLKYLMQKAEFIISRSGYSTIMDLMYMKKPAILIPTPGQTEQLYLARHLKNKPLPFVFVNEKDLDLKRQVKNLKIKQASSKFPSSSSGLEEEIENFEHALLTKLLEKNDQGSNHEPQ